MWLRWAHRSKVAARCQKLIALCLAASRLRGRIILKKNDVLQSNC